MNENELTDDELDTVIGNSKYLTTASNYKSKFDPSDILVFGTIPQYNGSGDKLVCALEVGKFINSNGLDLQIYGDNLANFLSSIEAPHVLILTQQIEKEMLDLLKADERVARFVTW